MYNLLIKILPIIVKEGLILFFTWLYNVVKRLNKSKKHHKPTKLK